MTVPVKRPYAARDPAKQPSKTEPQPPPPAKRPKPPRKKPVPGRKPGRPRKTAPLGLADLPVEIVGRIAAFLLPPPVTTQDGFLPPGTMPYSGPRLKSRTAKVKTSAYGGIPSGVKDIMALALSCRHCDAGVALIIGRMGNGMSEGKKRSVVYVNSRGLANGRRTMYISLPNEPGANHLVPTEGTLDQSPMLQLYQHIAASSGTLETAVFHQVRSNSKFEYPRSSIPVLPCQKEWRTRLPARWLAPQIHATISTFNGSLPKSPTFADWAQPLRTLHLGATPALCRQDVSAREARTSGKRI